MDLHHSAFTIKRGTLPLIEELFKICNLENVYQPEEDWALFKQKDNDTRIQIIEVDKKTGYFEGKEEMHIGFISENPLKKIQMIKTFAETHNLTVIQNQWSDLEYWFDIPELFVNFVIEIMDKKILKDD
jgi:hypothetical protein